MQIGNFDPLTLVGVLFVLTMLPFIVVIATSFVKLVVVLQLIRNALGLQQIPPMMVINGLALILTIYIMAPVISQSADALADMDIKTDRGALTEAGRRISVPIKGFLLKHCHESERNFFIQAAKSLWPKEMADSVQQDDLLVLIPAFTISELTSAFEIGFLLYLPFLVIDLITANILLAMGMMMVSPMTVSLPFKLLLFIMLSGWTRLIHGLITTYR
jgi:type III secretion protein R